jgi:hypothetical protein
MNTPNTLRDVRFLTAVWLRIEVFWDVTLCLWIRVDRATFHLNPQQISSYHKFTVTVLHNNDFRILDNTATQNGLFSLLSN